MFHVSQRLKDEIDERWLDIIYFFYERKTILFRVHQFDVALIYLSLIFSLKVHSHYVKKKR